MSQLGPPHSVTKWLRTWSAPPPRTLLEACRRLVGPPNHRSGVQAASLRESTMTGRRSFHQPHRHLLAWGPPHGCPGAARELSSALVQADRGQGSQGHCTCVHSAGTTSPTLCAQP